MCVYGREGKTGTFYWFWHNLKKISKILCVFMAFRTHPSAQNLHNDNLPPQMNLLLEGLGVGEEEFRTWTKKNWKQKVHLSHLPPNQIPQLDLYSAKPQLLISNRVLAEEKWLSSNKRDCVEYPFWMSHTIDVYFTFLPTGVWDISEMWQITV